MLLDQTYPHLVTYISGLWYQLLDVVTWIKDFLGDSVVENPLDNAGDTGDIGLIPRSRRYTGEGNGNPLQYSYLGISMDRGALRAIVHLGLQRDGHN